MRAAGWVGGSLNPIRPFSLLRTMLAAALVNIQEKGRPIPRASKWLGGGGNSHTPISSFLGKSPPEVRSQRPNQCPPKQCSDGMVTANSGTKGI